MPTVLQPNFDAVVHQMVQAVVTVFGRHQPHSMRLDLLDVDAKSGAGAKTVGSCKSGVQHSDYSSGLCTDRAQGFSHLQYLAGRVPYRWRDDHCVYGIRYAQEAPNSWAGTTHQ